MSHAFVIPVYRRPDHLRDCLQSLQQQTLHSTVVLASSTPSNWLDAVAAEFGLQLVVHGPNRGIGHDWNVALAQTDADWVTVAHQDDVYHPRFAEATMAAVARHPAALLLFTDYEELVNGQARRHTPLLWIKKLLLELGFLGREAIHSESARRMTMRFGCPIPCPSVTLRREAFPGFDEALTVGLDWAAWLDLCRRPGAFVWVREVLMAHRIHQASETSAAIGAGRRAAEDERLLQQLWPGWIARMIVRCYRLAYASNRT